VDVDGGWLEMGDWFVAAAVVLAERLCRWHRREVVWTKEKSGKLQPEENLEEPKRKI
jgi:hypothetical protein